MNSDTDPLRDLLRLFGNPEKLYVKDLIPDIWLSHLREFRRRFSRSPKSREEVYEALGLSKAEIRDSESQRQGTVDAINRKEPQLRILRIGVETSDSAPASRKDMRDILGVKREVGQLRERSSDGGGKDAQPRTAGPEPTMELIGEQDPGYLSPGAVSAAFEKPWDYLKGTLFGYGVHLCEQGVDRESFERVMLGKLPPHRAEIVLGRLGYKSDDIARLREKYAGRPEEEPALEGIDLSDVDRVLEGDSVGQAATPTDSGNGRADRIGGVLAKYEELKRRRVPYKPPAAEPSNDQAAQFVVGYRRGKSWSYREFPDKEKASGFIIELDSQGAPYRAFVKKNVRVRSEIVWQS